MALYSNLTKQIIANFWTHLVFTRQKGKEQIWIDLREEEKVPGHGRKENKEILFKVKILNSSDNQLVQAALIFKGIYILHRIFSLSLS